MLLKNERNIKGKPKVHYSLVKYNKKGSYDILKEIIEHVTLVQLLDSLGNVNHDISIVGYWIFESNYIKALVLNIKSLDMICAPSGCEEQVDEFEKLFTTVRYICFDARLKNN